MAVLCGILQAGALLALVFSRLPWPVAAPLILWTALCTGRTVHDHWPGRLHSIKSLRMSPEGSFSLVFRSSSAAGISRAEQVVPVSVSRCWSLPFVAGIEFRAISGRCFSLYLFRDRIDAVTWRRLGVRIRQR